MTYTRNVVDTDLRERVFDALICEDDTNFVKINDRQYGIILTDLNGVERYVRIGAIVAFLLAGIISGPFVLDLFQVNSTWTCLGDLGILFLWCNRCRRTQR